MNIGFFLCPNCLARLQIVGMDAEGLDIMGCPNCGYRDDEEEVIL